MASRGAPRYTPEQWAATLERIATDLSVKLLEIAPENGPSYAVVKSRSRHDPELRQAYRAAIARREALSLATIGRKRAHNGGFRPGFNAMRGQGNKHAPENWAATFELIATRLDVTLQDIAPKGLPSYLTAVKKASSHPEIRAGLKAALERRAKLKAQGVEGAKTGRGIAYTDAAYRAYLEKVRQCEPGCCHVRDARDVLSWPGLPSFDSVRRREEYKDELNAILKERGIWKPPGQPKNANAPLKTYSEAAYDRALELIGKLTTNRYMEYRAAHKSEPLPSYQQLYRRAEKNAAFREKLYALRPPLDRETFRYDDAAYNLAVSKIGEVGWTKFGETREHGVLPSLPAIHRRARGDAEYKGRLQAAVLARRELKRAARQYAKSKKTERPSGQLARLLLQQDAYRIADKFVPRYYDRADRDDIKSDIVMAVVAGEFGLDEISDNARWFISEHFRGSTFSSGRFGSLDAPVFHDSDTPLVDRLSSDDYMHAG